MTPMAEAALNPDIPDDLTELNRWVPWRYETRDGKSTKVPYNLRGYRASTTNSLDWASAEAVSELWRRATNLYAGRGFVFVKTDLLVGIDLDDCLDHGNLKPWARGVVERFSDTYMETSPSGDGIKIWCRGSLPANVPGIRVGDGAIELYDHARFFTVTGCAFHGAPLQVEDHAADVMALYNSLTMGKKHWPLQPPEEGRIPYGQQHSTLVSLAGTLRARHVCEYAIEACLLEVNKRQCEKPGPEQNIRRIVRSTRRWGAV